MTAASGHAPVPASATPAPGTPASGHAPIRRLRRAVADRRALAPVHAAVGAELRGIDPGRCSGRMPLADGADDPLSGLLVLADFVVGLAVTGTIGPGERITTLRLTVQTLGAPAGRELSGDGHLDHRAGGVGVSSAGIRDATGATVARCTGRNAILADGIGDSFADDDGPDWAAEPRAVADLLPLEVTEEGPDGLAVLTRPDPASVNSAGVVQGGALASVAARGIGRVLGAAPQELGVTFLRAVPADGSAVTGRVRAEHLGRRLRAGRAELHDARGRLLLSAEGLAYTP